jgi:hypothetical protein
MKLREAELLREKADWLSTQQQFNQYLEALHMEKAELIRAHTLDTADLRKKNNILRETMDKLEQQLKSSSSNTFTSEFGDFENITMDQSPWEDFAMVNDMSLDAEPIAADNSMSLVKTEKADKAMNQSEYPFSWNAFYMCLLFGAFIASNSASLSSAALPKLSDEYRAESANVLKAVLASAPSDAAAPSSSAHAGPTAAAAATAAHLPTIPSAEMAGMATVPAPQPSALEHLHNNLAMPSKQQQNDQVFALNPEQYNALTTFEDDVDFKPPQQPSNLQQALAAMRSSSSAQRGHDARTSDVYSRSLLWDRVPEKVVRDFKRMVRECGTKNA